MLKPNEREFEALAAQGYNLIPVWRGIAADLETPDLYLMLTDTVLIFDTVRQTLKIVANVALEDHGSTRAAYRGAAARIDELIARLDAPARAPRLEGAGNFNGDVNIVSNQT